MEMTLNDNFLAIENDDLELVNGGLSAMSIITCLSGISATIAIVQAIGGASIINMVVGALLACGPTGWALVAIGCVGAAASGWVIGKY